MFEKALRNKYRFHLNGSLSVEDLWDLTVGRLDLIYQSLTKEKKDSKGASLLTPKTKANQILKDKIAIVKYIVETKLAEQEARTKVLDNQAKKQKIMSIIEDKQNDALAGKSIEELMELVDSL